MTRLHNSGSGLVYSTFLGGTPTIRAEASLWIPRQPARDWLHVFERFPTTNPIQAAFAGTGDAFVTKLNPEGTAPVYSTFLGGAGGDEGAGIALDSSGDAVHRWIDRIVDFPVTPGAFQAVPGLTSDAMCCNDGPWDFDAFIAKIGADAGPGIATAPGALSFGDQQIGTTSGGGRLCSGDR